MRNETRGSSRLDPVQYKGDVVAQCWIDSRVIATLSEWLDGQGVDVRKMSEVVRVSLELLCEHLTRERVVEIVDDTGEARRMLERKYRVNLNPCGRGMKNVLHNLALTSMRGDIPSERERGSAEEIALAKRNKEDRIQMLLDRALEAYEEEERKRIDKSAVYDLEEMKRQGLVIEE